MKSWIILCAALVTVAGTCVPAAAVAMSSVTVQSSSTLLSHTSQTAKQPPKPRNAKTAIWLSLLLGFGSGHFYLHADSAWKILAAESGCVAGAVLGGLLEAAATSPHSSGSLFAGLGQAVLGAGLIGASGITFVVLRVLEDIDIFKVVNEDRQRGLVAAGDLFPIIRPTATGVQLGLRVELR